MAIRLDYEGGKSCVDKMAKSIEELSETAQTIDATMMTKLGEFCEGGYYDKILETYQAEYQKFLKQDVPQMVTKLNDYMSNCMETLKKVDEELAGR